MSRTQVRIVLILIAFILVMAAILFGILTYWVGADGSLPSTPEGNGVLQALLAAGCPQIRSWQPQRTEVHATPGYFVAG